MTFDMKVRFNIGRKLAMLKNRGKIVMHCVAVWSSVDSGRSALNSSEHVYFNELFTLEVGELTSTGVRELAF